jgi:acyl dehydratase
MTDKLYFEDIEVGQTFTGDTIVVDREIMLMIARDFDNQRMHLDAEAAKAMGFDDVIASGAYTFAAAIKTVQSILNRFHFLPSGRGIELSFVRPVLAGNTITAHAEIISKRPSDKGSRGWAVFKTDYVNQDGVTVAEVNWLWLFKTRPID